MLKVQKKTNFKYSRAKTPKKLLSNKKRANSLMKLALIILFRFHYIDIYSAIY